MASRGRPANTPFALAAELEPGETYVLNDLAALGMFRNKLAGKAELKDHVGLNLDIAHMRIGEPLIGAADLRPFRDLVVHAHISDHPGMHTRDQVVGRWTSIERRDSGYVPYFELLQDRLRSRADVGLPFSGAVALELEGCNRLRWIIDSLNAMKMIAAMTAG